MNKKLPGVFVNKIDKKINNNETVYYGEKDKKESLDIGEKKDTPLNIRQKISKLFQSENYVYKLDVEIILKEGIITKKIIGYNDKGVITFDNELIPLSDILDIYIKK